MLVTLMTDASHCPETGAAGFGFWCVSNRGKLAGGAAFRDLLKDSYEAEFKGVANSLKASIDAGLIFNGDKVLIQLDCIGVIYCIVGKSEPRDDVVVVLNYIQKIAKQYELKLMCRHVKGHTKRLEGNRFKANNHCDDRAKKAMREARKILKKAKNES